jgi:hypothetical protein
MVTFLMMVLPSAMGEVEEAVAETGEAYDGNGRN